jgi:hypothetical protein
MVSTTVGVSGIRWKCTLNRFRAFSRKLPSSALVPQVRVRSLDANLRMLTFPSALRRFFALHFQPAVPADKLIPDLSGHTVRNIFSQTIELAREVEEPQVAEFKLHSDYFLIIDSFKSTCKIFQYLTVGVSNYFINS